MCVMVVIMRGRIVTVLMMTMVERGKLVVVVKHYEHDPCNLGTKCGQRSLLQRKWYKAPLASFWDPHGNQPYVFLTQPQQHVLYVRVPGFCVCVMARKLRMQQCTHFLSAVVTMKLISS